MGHCVPIMPYTVNVKRFSFQFSRSFSFLNNCFKVVCSWFFRRLDTLPASFSECLSSDSVSSLENSVWELEQTISCFFGVECGKVNGRSLLNDISLFIDFVLYKSSSFPEWEMVREYDSNMLSPDCEDVCNELMISWDVVKCSTEVWDSIMEDKLVACTVAESNSGSGLVWNVSNFSKASLSPSWPRWIP